MRLENSGLTHARPVSVVGFHAEPLRRRIVYQSIKAGIRISNGRALIASLLLPYGILALARVGYCSGLSRSE